MTTAFMFAGSLRQAKDTAEGWEWQRVGFDNWETPDGEAVRFIYGAHPLRGKPFNTRLYIGDGATEHRDSETLRAIIARGEVVVVRGELRPLTLASSADDAGAGGVR